MRTRTRFGAIALAIALLGAQPAISREPDTYEGLLKVDSSGFDAAYLLPGADFAGYQRIMLDQPEVAFHKNWLRDYNDSVSFSDRIGDEEALEILAEMQAGLQDAFLKACADAGYEIVTTPGPDVLRLRTEMIKVWVVAPDTMSAGRGRTYAKEAGTATLVIEARDAMSGELLARGLDKRTIGETGHITRRSRVTNKSDFQQVFTRWAKASAVALGALRAMKPINDEGESQ